MRPLKISCFSFTLSNQKIPILQLLINYTFPTDKIGSLLFCFLSILINSLSLCTTYCILRFGRLTANCCFTVVKVLLKKITTTTTTNNNNNNVLVFEVFYTLSYIDFCIVFFIYVLIVISFG